MVIAHNLGESRGRMMGSDGSSHSDQDLHKPSRDDALRLNLRLYVRLDIIAGPGELRSAHQRAEAEWDVQ